MRKFNQLFDIIEGEDMFEPSQTGKQVIVEGFLNKGDYVLLASEQKAGKTILCLNLASCVSSGSSFLSAFPTSESKVIYMYNECSDDLIKDHLRRIRSKVPTNKDNLKLVPIRFHFNTPEGHKSLKQLVERLGSFKPDVIILDALYLAVKGSLKQDEVVGDFQFVLRWLQDVYGCAVIVVHHLVKPSTSPDGKSLSRGDFDAYGSVFLLANPDHVLRLERFASKDEKESKKNAKDRILRCTTQRANFVPPITRIKLYDKDSLFFEVKDLRLEHETLILETLKAGAFTVKQIAEQLDVHECTIYRCVSSLMEKGLIEKSKGYHKTISLVK